jgi:hypothetical protein
MQLDRAKTWSSIQRWGVVRTYLFSATIGFILIGAGYMPIIAVFLPSLSGIGSRFNIFATIGGALFLGSVLVIGGTIFARSREQIKYLFLTSAVLFVLLGIGTHASVQYHNRIAWQEQRAIWQMLFSAAPNFKDDTMVLFILPGFQERTGFYNWRRTPLSASWEASSGLRLLYNNPTLSGDVYFPDIEEPIEPILTTEGVLSQETGQVTLYNRIVVFMYSSDTDTLQQLDQLPARITQHLVDPVKLCSNCILNEAVRDIPLRRLVQDRSD